MTIRYVIGDATHPQGTPPCIIVHVCNDVGKWGKGFVMAITRRWPEPENHYRRAFQGPIAPTLGEVQWVPVTPEITVANVIGQHGVANARTKTAPVRYDAIRAGLFSVGDRALLTQASIHMPRIGCGLAGGQWQYIEPIIHETLVARGLSVSVYDLPA